MSRLPMVAMPVVAACLLVALPGLAKPRLALFRAENRGLSLSDGAMETLDARLSRTFEVDFELMPRDVLAEKLRARSSSVQRTCQAESCLLAAARDAGAEKAVQVVLMRLGDRCVAIGTLYDIATWATERTASAEAPCSLDDLLGAVNVVSERVRGKSEVPAASGKVETRPNCAAVCQRFGQAIPGSEGIREPMRNRCLARCGAGDVRFAVCAWKVKDPTGAQQCLDLPETTGGTLPGVAASPGPAPVATPTPAASPAPALAAAAREGTATRPKCDAVCDRFVTTVPASDELRRPIRDRCMARCGGGDMKFSVCAWRAQSASDADACLALPAPNP